MITPNTSDRASERANAFHLSRRERQVLVALLGGASEKQAAQAINVSRHTVHIYVKALYRHFDVASRGELLARFIPEAIRNAIAAGSLPGGAMGGT
jgi:DNA-binding NarL/FixJ family response regulator